MIVCGCAAPRRRCDVCEGDAFLACSSKCLSLHLRECHPTDTGLTSLDRAFRFQTEVNRLGVDSWQAYHDHREALTKWVGGFGVAPAVCVLGAGNCNDLDLKVLFGKFSEVHLVDLDNEALDRAVDHLTAEQRARVTTHARVDLTGCLSRLDEWGDRLPTPAEFKEYVMRESRGTAQTIGKQFDVVLSDCLLSQLCAPFQNMLALNLMDWMRLMGAVTHMHLMTVALLTRVGGTALIACDVLSFAGSVVNELATSMPRQELKDELARRVESGSVLALPNPKLLAGELRKPPFSQLAMQPEITDPWLWELGGSIQLVYGLSFVRSDPAA